MLPVPLFSSQCEQTQINVTCSLPVVSVFVCFITIRKQSCEKVMLLHLSVSHSVQRGCIPACTGQIPPGSHPPRQTPPGQTPSWPGLPLGRDPQAETSRQTPRWQQLPPQADTPCRRLLRWTVRILLECISVDIGVNSPD